MSSRTPGPLDRPNPSTVLREVRKARPRSNPKEPAARMEAAFLLSVQARKLRWAALAESGLTEDQISDSLRMRYK